MSISSYCSVGYCAIFLPIVILIYSFTPQKHRWISLLISSYVFFSLLSGKLIVYLLLSTLCIYFVGRYLSHQNNKYTEALKYTGVECDKAVTDSFLRNKRIAVIIAVLLHITALFVLKYSKFFIGNINDLFSLFNMQIKFEIPKIAAPIGISFYSLQAISYVSDVYNKRIKADRHLGRVALYMSFFPQIMEGPICKYSDTANQLFLGERIHYSKLTFGIQRIGYGLMKKVVVADRLNTLVKMVFSDFNDYDGTITAVAVICYTCQLYMEFSGTMDIVIGSAEIFNIKLPENFSQPFFSKSISEFWQRWHITLGAWFKNYIYFPVTTLETSKKLTKKAKKSLGKYYGPMLISTIALFCVWLCNGMWHGSGWRYIFFGIYHFVLITIGNMVKPCIKNINKKLSIKTNNIAYISMQIIRTSILVCFGELFFRADGLRAGFTMFKKIFSDFSVSSLSDGTLLKLGLDLKDYIIVVITVLIVFIIGIMKEKGYSPRSIISAQKLPLRWTIYFALLFFIIIFGAYGTGYVPVDPIYADF